MVKEETKSGVSRRTIKGTKWLDITRNVFNERDAIDIEMGHTAVIIQPQRDQYGNVIGVSVDVSVHKYNGDELSNSPMRVTKEEHTLDSGVQVKNTIFGCQVRVTEFFKKNPL